MTVAISADSPRRAAAERFAAELRRAMQVRGVGRRRLAECMGMSSASLIAQWRSGNTLPRLDGTIELARVLKWPRLVELVRVARVRHCAWVECGREFVNEGGGPKRYCTDGCRLADERVRNAQGDTRTRAARATREADALKSSVASMCRACEPQGYCENSGCSLRAVSPLPLRATWHEVEEATPAPGPYGTPENRAKTVAATRAALAKRWSDPEQRELQAKRTSEFHASMTPEQKAEWRGSIVAARKTRTRKSARTAEEGVRLAVLFLGDATTRAKQHVKEAASPEERVFWQVIEERLERAGLGVVGIEKSIDQSPHARADVKEAA